MTIQGKKDLGWGGNFEKETRKYLGEQMEGKGYFSRFVGTDSSWCHLHILGDKSIHFLLA